jgi:hypothetical protein
MRDELPKRVWKTESAIINLDKKSGSGTHWVCYRKANRNVEYYDSYGNLRPPPELVQYWNSRGPVTVRYNYIKEQKIYNCGHLCLKFLFQ